MESRETASDQNKEMLNRREALTKAGCITLSAATMMILMKSQPAKATSVVSDQTTLAAPNTSASTTESWQRTTTATRQ